MDLITPIERRLIGDLQSQDDILFVRTLESRPSHLPFSAKEVPHDKRHDAGSQAFMKIWKVVNLNHISRKSVDLWTNLWNWDEFLGEEVHQQHEPTNPLRERSSQEMRKAVVDRVFCQLFLKWSNDGCPLSPSTNGTGIDTSIGNLRYQC